MSENTKEFLKINLGQLGIIFTILGSAFIFYAKFEVMNDNLQRAIRILERHEEKIHLLQIEVEKIKTERKQP